METYLLSLKLINANRILPMVRLTKNPNKPENIYNLLAATNKFVMSTQIGVTKQYINLNGEVKRENTTLTVSAPEYWQYMEENDVFISLIKASNGEDAMLILKEFKE